jgi:hypothetical protein
VQRNALIVTMSGTLNVDVGVMIRGVYVEIEGVDFDPNRGVVALELDQKALELAIITAVQQVGGEGR